LPNLKTGLIESSSGFTQGTLVVNDLSGDRTRVMQSNQENTPKISEDSDILGARNEHLGLI
jgi:hypothetical protein